MLKISWPSAASDDLAKIITYVAERSPQAARDLKEHIQGAVLPAAEHPYLYRQGRIPGTREMAVCPNLIVVYELDGRDVVILNMLRAAQQWPKSDER